MAYSNWKQTSAWGAIDDPTGVLNGKVLVATSGLTLTTEDYLTQVVGTSTEFNIANYSAIVNYAWPSTSGAHPFTAGKFNLVARAGSYSTSSPNHAQQCYLAGFDVENNTCKISKRYQGVETILAESTIPLTILNTNQKHTMEFKCYGTTSVSLQLLIDQMPVVNIGDISSTKLTSGDVGLSVTSGTIYLDSFTVMQYTSTGTAPEAWIPTQMGTNTLSVWLKSSAGISTVTSGTTNYVATWDDQSGNNNNASQGTLVNMPQYLPSSDPESISGYNGIKFTTTNILDIAHSTTLNMNTDGMSVFFVMNPTSFGVSSGGLTKSYLIDKFAAVSSTYQFFTTDTRTATQPEAGLGFFGASAVGSTSSSISLNNYQISGFVTCVSGVTNSNVSGFWVNGSNKGDIVIGTGTDNTGTFRIGATGTSDWAYNGMVAEVIVCKGEVSQDNRQKIEGYLAHRYGIWPSLPTNHPYRTIAPTV